MIDLYPAIDLLGGRVVRLRQGDYADETVYGDDPVAVARDFAEAGAPWVHVVDLDAARSGDPVNRPVVAAIAAAVAGVASVQTGGGVRSLDDARELADAGVARVVMGSAAVREPGARRGRVGDRAGCGRARPPRRRARRARLDRGQRLDARRCATRCSRPRRCSSITDIGRDGMLAGPDIDGLPRSADWPARR